MTATAAYITHIETATTVTQVPRTVTCDTDPALVDTAMRAFYRRAHDEFQFSGGVFPFGTLLTVAEALTEHGAITCTYTNEDGATKARTIFPYSIHLTDARKVEIKGYCTVRQMVRSFRLDRMAGVHVVTLPGERAA